MENEAGDRQSQDDQRTPEQTAIAKMNACVGLGEYPPALGRSCSQLVGALVIQPECAKHQGKQHQHDRPQIRNEIDEIESGRAPDEDIRRIADDGRRAADVAGDDLCDQDRAADRDPGPR